MAFLTNPFYRPSVVRVECLRTMRFLVRWRELKCSLAIEREVAFEARVCNWCDQGGGQIVVLRAVESWLLSGDKVARKVPEVDLERGAHSSQETCAGEGRLDLVARHRLNLSDCRDSRRGLKRT